MLLAAPALLLAPQLVGPPQSFAVPSAPYGLEVADLDGDGDLDLVAALRTTDAIYVLYNDGAGQFGSTALVSVGDGPVAVAAGDVDGDGVTDLVTANLGGSDASVLLGSGGSFGPVAPVALGAQPRCLALADLDGDGALDLVVGTLDAEDVRVLPGVGDGTFGAATAYPLEGSVLNLSFGDVDGDGDTDFVAATSLGGNQLFRNGGGLAFTVEDLPMAFSNFGRWVELADVDEDGDLDLVWLEDEFFSADVVVRTNDGTGDFSGFPVELSFSLGQPDLLCVADLTGDGDPEVLAAGIGGPPASDAVWTFTAGPGLTFPGGIDEAALGNDVAALRAGDLDGDGLADLVLANRGDASIELLFNALCPGPPAIAQASPTVVPALTTEPVLVAVDGCGLSAVDQVTLGGAPVPFALVDAQQVVVELPPAPQLGAVPLVLTSSLGSDAVDVTFTAPAPPVLTLPALSVSGGLELLVGAGPGDLAFVAVSVHLSPTNLPGLVDLDIGSQGQNLVLLKTLTIPAKGWRELTAPIPGSLLIATFHFQAAIATPPAPTFPLATSNVASGAVGF